MSAACRVPSKQSPRGLAYGVLLVLLAALAVPVFAHGCHAGDHDDEPLVVPNDERFPR